MSLIMKTMQYVRIYYSPIGGAHEGSETTLMSMEQRR